MGISLGMGIGMRMFVAKVFYNIFAFLFFIFRYCKFAIKININA